MLLQLVAVFSLVVGLARGQTTPAQAPRLAESFSVAIEATHVEGKRTFFIDEVFLKENGAETARVAIQNNGTTRVILIDALHNLSIVFDVTRRTCHARNLTAGRIHATLGADGHYHLPSASDLFKFGKQYGYTKASGTQTVRGITCDHYTSTSTTMTATGFSITKNHDWYFKHADWTSPAGPVDFAIPVRAKVVVTSTGSDTSTHIYDFVDYVPGHRHFRPASFSLPDGIPCSNLPASYERPLPRLPRQFTLTARSINEDELTSYSETFAYDAIRRETAVERSFTPPPGHFGHATLTGKHRIIHNFREGTQYNISNYECSMEALTAVAKTKMFHDISLLNSHAELASGSDIFGLHKNINATYQGTRIVGGLVLDLWLVFRDDVPLIPEGPAIQPTFWEYYFSDTEWTFVSKDGVTTHGQSPYLIEGHSLLPEYSHVHSRLFIDTFEVGPPKPELFDDSHCFSTSQQSTEQFTMETNFDNHRKLHRGIVSKLATVMEVTEDRFHVNYYPGPGNELVVLVRVHDVPTKGDPAFLRRLVSRKEAAEDLRKEISKGDFKVSANGVTAVAKRRSHSSSSQDDKVYALNTGEAVGLSFGVLILGVISGVAVLYLVQKKVAKDVPYKQDVV